MIGSDHVYNLIVQGIIGVLQFVIIALLIVGVALFGFYVIKKKWRYQPKDDQT